MRRVSPVSVYCVAAYGFIRSGIMYFHMMQLENEFAFIVRTMAISNCRVYGADGISGVCVGEKMAVGCEII